MFKRTGAGWIGSAGRYLVMGLATAALGPAACGGPSEPSLKFTAIPGDNTNRLADKFAPLERYLSQQLGVAVRYVPTTSYSASVESFVNGDVHLAWFGGLTGVRARQKVVGAVAIAQGRADPQYHSYFIANTASGIEPSDSFPAGLAGRKFAFGSSSSTSGRLMPEFFIRQFTGQAPADYFDGQEMSFSGSHEKTAKLVEAGTFDAGAMDYKTFDRMIREKLIDPEKVQIIWKTPPYPDYHWTIHPDVEKIFGAGFIARTQEALIQIKDRELLEAINRPEGLIGAGNSDWDDLRDLAKSLGLVR